MVVRNAVRVKPLGKYKLLLWQNCILYFKYVCNRTYLIVFLEKGSGQVSTDFRLPGAISDIVTGIILFFIIGCEFFLQYKVVISKNAKEGE